MSIREVTIPDIGDAEDVEVIEICVQTGDVVELDDALIVIESDKASMELPAPFAGTVTAIAVALGDQVNQGDAVLSLEEVREGGAASAEESGAVGDKTPALEAEIVAPQVELEEVAQQVAAEESRPATAGSGVPETVEVRIPDIGEAKDVVVIEVAVAAGQDVAEDDLLVVVESDKASMEIPSPYAGKIREVAVSEGAEVDEGTLLVVIEVVSAALSAPVASEVSKPYRPLEDTVAATPSAVLPTGPEQTPSTVAPTADEASGNAARSVYAGPAVRRLARELGVDLARVTGSGAKGRIVKDDVKEHVKSILEGNALDPDGGAIPAVPQIDFARFGATETVALTRVRVRGARNLHASWLNVVHVTQHDEADVTELELFRKSLAGAGERREIKLTPLPFIMKVCQHLLKEHPNFNASLDQAVENLILKQYFNIGFAVDTEEGLVVPVIRDVDQKGIWQLGAEIAEVSQLARARKLKPDHLQGGCFTISSLGAIGGTAFTPIVNAPEVAILGVARLTTKPVWDGAEFRPRGMLPLSLSYDHRAINGAEAGRFMVQLCAALTDVRQLLL